MTGTYSVPTFLTVAQFMFLKKMEDTSSFIVVIEYFKKLLHHIPSSLLVAAVTSALLSASLSSNYYLKHLLVNMHTHSVQGTGDTIQSSNL